MLQVGDRLIRIIHSAFTGRLVSVSYVRVKRVTKVYAYVSWDKIDRGGTLWPRAPWKAKLDGSPQFRKMYVRDTPENRVAYPEYHPPGWWKERVMAAGMDTDIGEGELDAD